MANYVYAAADLAELAGRRFSKKRNLIAQAHREYAWTVELLAKEVGASRTVLADRFAHYIGEPPMHYLARWRLAIAADLLRSGRTGLTRVAEAVGYQSDAAFIHAFRREYGSPPATWRRQGEQGHARQSVRAGN